MRLLLLGGTGEARALAAALDGSAVEVISSLAGRVSNPALPVGAVRVGGFGGISGLIAYLQQESIDAVVDATHPFAATMTSHAAVACATAGVPLLVLQRPSWAADATWTRVPDIASAAATAAASARGTIFLTTGKRDLAVFIGDDAHDYLVRAVDPPELELPANFTVLLDRGPYTLDREREVMRDVSLLVTKDSGGSMTSAKLDAARELSIPVIVVDRPPLPEGVPVTSTVEAAAAWAIARA